MAATRCLLNTTASCDLALGSWPTPTALTTYLHHHIPLTAAMQLSVQQASEQGLTLQLPLAPNHNHQGTAFGGSLSTAATVAAWSYLSGRLAANSVRAVVVVARAEQRFLAPVAEDFVVHAIAPDESDWAEFWQRLQHKGRASLTLTAEIKPNQELALVFEGRFHVSVIE